MKNEKDIIKADKSYRQKLMILFLCGIVIAVVLMIIINNFNVNTLIIAESSPEEALQRVGHFLRMISLFIFLSGFGFGYYFLHLALDIKKHKRFPPPDKKVLKDTELLTGQKAVNRAHATIIIAILMFVMGLLIPWFLFRFYETLYKGF